MFVWSCCGCVGDVNAIAAASSPSLLTARLPCLIPPAAEPAFSHSRAQEKTMAPTTLPLLPFPMLDHCTRAIKRVRGSETVILTEVP